MEITNIEESVVIKDFPDYKVDKAGNVIRISDGYKIPWLYPKVQLKDKEGNSKLASIHALVAKTFIEKPDSEEELIVGHKDDDKQNPNAYNLHWITKSQNNIEAYANNRQRIDDGYRSNCKPVIAKLHDSNEILEFGGIRLAARKLALDSGSIKECCKGRRSHAKGWQFLYKEDYTGEFPEVKVIPRYNLKAVEQLDLEGKYIKTFNSAREAAIEVGCPFAKISSVANGNRKTTGGYKWRFVEA